MKVIASFPDKDIVVYERSISEGRGLLSMETRKLWQDNHLTENSSYLSMIKDTQCDVSK